MRNTSNRHRSACRAPAFRLRPVAFALVCAGVLPAWGQVAYPVLPTWGANYTGAGTPFTVTRGTATVGSGPGNLPLNAGTGLPDAFGTVLPIVQTSNRAIIDWQGFSIGAGNQVNIAQPSTASVLLNRVTGPQTSTIAGSLTANGRVFLTNPNGVTFTKTATVNVGGLIASSLNMSTSDDDFMSGTNNIAFGLVNNTLVDNQGQITTPFGGTVALLSGDEARNSGVITTPGGTAALAAGSTVTLDIGGDGLTRLVATPSFSVRGVTNTGTLQADGGRVALIAASGAYAPLGVVNTAGVLRADSLVSRNGEIVLDSGASTPGVTVSAGTLSASGVELGLPGGSIAITGQKVLLEPVTVAFGAGLVVVPTSLNAGGDTGGGSITVRAVAVGGQPQTGALAVAASTTFNADAGVSGNGGTVRLLGDRTLRAYGTVSARGGANGGNGGQVETSGGYAVPVGEVNGGFDLNGIRVDASAPGGGKAGSWLIDPYNVTVAHGGVAGNLPVTGVFDPVAASVLQDGDINAALNSGTNVKVTTGSAGTGAGTITLNQDVDVHYTAAKGALGFELAANRDILAVTPGAVIRSSGAGGPLNVALNAGVNADGSAAIGGGQILYTGNIYSNGGSVTMNASTATANQSGIRLEGTVDTRGGNNLNPDNSSTGGQNGNAGGAVLLNGASTVAGAIGSPGVGLVNTQLLASTGNVTINGSSAGGNGVDITGGAIATTSGVVTVTGRGRNYTSGIVFPTAGVLVSQASIGTVSGGITLRGYVDDTTPAVGSAGVRMANGAQLATTGGGDIEVTGRALTSGNGLLLQTGGTGGIQGSRQVVLRAVNDGSTDAIAIASPVNAGTVLDLRPGGVDAAGNGFDSVATPVTLGGPAATGFALSAAELALLGAPALVVGSNSHAADISVVGPVVTASALTLQNQGGAGNINLNAPVTAPQLALLAGGNVAQASGAAITAGSLLARSTTGSVLLSEPTNKVGTVAGSAAGRFAYVDADALTIGPVAATAFDAAGNTAQVDAATSMAATTVFVRNLQGDLSLASNVSSTAGADLVAASRFQNVGGNTLSGAPWRIWADTWIGETRGGLSGSGPLPNFYHCAYLGLCTVTVTPGDNHFIYAQQPTATVLIGDATRVVGAPNPPFVYSVSGLILGDTLAGFSGAPSSPANAGSPEGVYPINGGFASAAGYAVNVVPGQLRVSAAPPPPPPPDFLLPRLSQLPKADVLRDLPTTYLYDRNIGQAPICLATGPLDGDRAQQGGDVLAREWSRVRSRPNLLSCVDTEKRNGCADF